MDPIKQEKIIENALLAGVVEQRRARRWRIFFFFIVIAYVGYISLYSSKMDIESEATKLNDHVAVVSLNSQIGKPATTKGLIESVTNAFENNKSLAVILKINSPGGSPVQSQIIYDELVHLRAQHPNKPLYAAIEDVGASGAYMVACSADKIYATPTSIVGSIGAMFSSFGLVDLMEKVGVSRRLITSGKYKGSLDPFSPTTEDDQKIIQSIVNNVKNEFVLVVKEGRQGKIDTENQELFTGRFWLGKEAMELGLVDDLGYVDKIVRDNFEGAKVVEYTPPINLKSILGDFGSKASASVKAIADFTGRLVT